MLKRHRCRSNFAFVALPSTKMTVSQMDVHCENKDETFCTACKDNYSLTLFNFDCRVCDDRYISLLLFFALAGIAFIAFLLIVRMTVAQGVINGLILYTNVFSIYSYFVFEDHKDVKIFLQVFIAWANFDFGFPTCFYSGLDHYTYTWLQFLFPLYLWLLIALIIVGCQLSSKFGSLLGSNPTAVLATVILMSFTKLIQTAEQALAWQRPSPADNMTEYRWRMDPNIKYWETNHAFLFIAAILMILLLLVPYIILLLFGYKLQKYSSRRGFRWFNYLMPFLDAYYAPYNKNSRFWIGFLLLIRSTLFLSLCFLRGTRYIPITMSIIFVAVLAIAWLNSRIYKSFYMEVLEASFILNICVLGIASYYVDIANHNQMLINNISAGIAFGEFIMIVLFHIFLCVKKVFIKDSEKFNSKYLLKLLKTCRASKQKDKSNNNIQTTNTNIMLIPLREPLLDDV